MTPHPGGDKRVLVQVDHAKGEQITMYVDVAGLTPDGYERWVIPTHVDNGDSVGFSPWPPDHPVEVLCNNHGRHASMFRYIPGDIVDDRLMGAWDWERKESAVVRLAEGFLQLHRNETQQSATHDQTDVVAGLDKAALVERLDKAALVGRLNEEQDPVVLWWVQKALDEAVATVKKAREYGSTELEYAGHVIGRIGNREVSKAEAMELQIFHYVLGKMGRWTAAVTRGEDVSDDTLFDFGVYVRMVQRIRETGEWP